jgi:serine/threonine protein kinase
MKQAAPSVEEIFFVALVLEAPDARSAFLNKVCGSPDVRQRVERLLAQDAQASRFLESPAPMPTAITPPDHASGLDQPGEVIGPYKLLKQIGEGGMGVVYMAAQTEPVRRTVALKVIKPGMDTKQVIARFEAELQALALMDHPNIAQVYDAGATNSGRPFFVMELICGIPITDYCEREQLSIHDRLELFLQLCHAVQHAHQKGIIHRDIKPSNVLITLHDGVPVPKVIDFGVAKAIGHQLTDKTLLTAYAQLIGTPLFMSPEQAELSAVDVDTRSDIYSLGAVLYELLTGTTPFDPETFRTAAFDEIRRIIREQEPHRPSARLSTLGATLTLVSANRDTDPRKLIQSFRGELDWIVMKALEKDRNRRYETASGLAADIRRYLNDEPVQACPASAAYRLRKILKRNRAALTTAGILAVALVMGTVVSTWQALRAREAERVAVSQTRRAVASEKKATLERDEAQFQRERANTRFRLAYQSVSQLAAVLGNVRSNGGSDRTKKLQRAIKGDLIRYHLQLLENNEDDPAITYELGDACLALTRLYNGPADEEKRRQTLTKALALYEQRARMKPDDTTIQNALACHYWRLGRYEHWIDSEREEALYQRALAIYKEVARQYPKRGHDWFLIIDVASWYEMMLRSQGRLAEAEALSRQVLPWFQRPEFDLNSLVGDMAEYGFVRLSDLLIRHDRLLEAIPVLEAARPHVLLDDQYRSYLDAVSTLCLKLAMHSDPAFRRRGVALARDNIEFTSSTDALPWFLLGMALERTGDGRGADAAFRKGIELGSPTLDQAWNRFAWRLVSRGEFRSESLTWAVDMAERAVRLAPASARNWIALGAARYRAGDWTNAIEALDKAEAMAPNQRFALTGFLFAMARWHRGEEVSARKIHDQALAWTVKNAPRDEDLMWLHSESAALLGVPNLRTPGATRGSFQAGRTKSSQASDNRGTPGLRKFEESHGPSS